MKIKKYINRVFDLKNAKSMYELNYSPVGEAHERYAEAVVYLNKFECDSTDKYGRNAYSINILLDGDRIADIVKVGHCHMCGGQGSDDELLRFPHKTLETEAEQVLDKLTTPESTFDDWFSKGVCHFHRDEHKEAIECYSKALKIEPNNFQSMANMAISLLKLNKTKESFRMFKKAFTLFPNIFPAWVNLGYYFIEKCQLNASEVGKKYNEDSKKALIAFRRAIAVNKDFGMANASLHDGSKVLVSDFVRMGKNMPDMKIDEILAI